MLDTDEILRLLAETCAGTSMFHSLVSVSQGPPSEGSLVTQSHSRGYVDWARELVAAHTSFETANQGDALSASSLYLNGMLHQPTDHDMISLPGHVGLTAVAPLLWLRGAEAIRLEAKGCVVTISVNRLLAEDPKRMMADSLGVAQLITHDRFDMLVQHNGNTIDTCALRVSTDDVFSGIKLSIWAVDTIHVDTSMKPSSILGHIIDRLSE